MGNAAFYLPGTLFSKGYQAVSEAARLIEAWALKTCSTLVTTAYIKKYNPSS